MKLYYIRSNNQLVSALRNHVKKGYETCKDIIENSGSKIQIQSNAKL